MLQCMEPLVRLSMCSLLLAIVVLLQQSNAASMAQHGQDEEGKWQDEKEQVGNAAMARIPGHLLNLYNEIADNRTGHLRPRASNADPTLLESIHSLPMICK